MSRISVVGAGAIGAMFGAELLADGHEVLFCSRRPFSRLRVESGVAPTDAAVDCLVDPRDVPPDWGSADWVLVAVKAHQISRIGPWLERVVGSGTTVVALQNGLGSGSELAAAGCRAEVLDAVVYCGAQSPTPGQVQHSGALELVVPEGKAARALGELYATTRATITVSSDFVTVRWRKVMLNCAANGITALTGRPLGVFARPEGAELARDLLAEALPVARAHGARLDGQDADRILDDLRRPTAAAVAPSMLQDRLLGRTTEHDALYGGVVRAAEQCGLTAPLHRFVQGLLVCGDPWIERTKPTAQDTSTDRVVRDKQAIIEVLHRYCHALDRRDRASADTLWHDGGTANYGSGDREDGTSAAFDGSAAEFLDWVFDRHAAFDGTSHQVTNILIECDGNRATSASYVTAALWTAEAVVTIRARYYDTWAHRSGRWAIENRRLEHDLRQKQIRPAAERG